MNDILTVDHVSLSFAMPDGSRLAVLKDIGLSIGSGECVGLIGESGCGKSTLARLILGLYQAEAGRVIWNGAPSGMHMIFQDSDGALDPRMTTRQILHEACRLAGRPTAQAEEALFPRVLERTGLAPYYLDAYPGELSGGQRQRIAIARCIVTKPQLILADEPIAALDVSIQAQILNLLKDLQQEYGFSMLFIAHDLAVVRHLCQRIYVMYEGEIVESGTTEDVFNHPGHPYTKLLLASILRPDPIYERTKVLPPYDAELFRQAPKVLR